MNDNDPDATMKLPDPGANPGAIPSAGELLARALRTPGSSIGDGRWTPPAPEELAALLPQYQIESLLGHGGMGAVYKGRQAALDRPVAIKLLPAEMAADAQFIARFQREARTLAKLQHPGIVAVHDFGQTSEGHLYFVMEFVDGTDLHRILHAPGGLNPAQALALISQICDALHYAHGKGVIHRDIKPGNILVTTDSRAKLADFGLARPIVEESTVLTGTNVIMGTAAYMAPEQQEGRSDQRADIYALGVMLYEMLCGQRPSGAFDPPSHRVQVDVRLDDVVIKAMQQQPERRYQQVSEMKTDVDRIRTTPQQNAERGTRSAEKKTSRVRATAIIAACLALASAGGFFIWEKMNASRASRPQAEPGSVAESSPALQRVEPSSASGRPDGLKPPTTLPAATKDKPFANTLGQEFVPVPGTQVLFCRWETRVKDYAEFARVNKIDSAWATQQKDGVPVSREPEYPVSGVSWDGANAFCKWLTEKESTEGKLPKGMNYRLPTDEEWSRAVGLAHEEGTTPKERSGANGVDFPWGTGWPPNGKAGNYADETFHGKFPNPPEKWIEGYTDGFATTAPVGSFAPNEFGIYDLGGNVWEWCEDWYDANQNERTLRGASWNLGVRSQLLSSYRLHDKVGRLNLSGFRCVLAPAASTPPAAASGEVLTFAGHRYQFVPDKCSWTEAKSKAEAMGGHLATLTTPDEESWVYAHAVPVEKAVWIGGFAPEKEVQLRWVTGEPIGRLKWGVGQPSWRSSGSAKNPLSGSLFKAGVLLKHGHADVAIADHAYDGFLIEWDDAGSVANASPPASATKDAPFVNTLGMKFVPVPITGGPTGGQRVLFSVWETRVQDYGAFATETKRAWSKPKFEQGPTHPAVMVSWEDAQAFCTWLTERERKTGKLAANERYRLPSDHEWSCAVGIGDREDPALAPSAKDGRIKDVYPWGGTWPPPERAGNYSGEEAAGHETYTMQKILPGYRDEFPETAPVGSFPANSHGLYDLGGNATEWCEELAGIVGQPLGESRILRGASFSSGDRLLSSQRSSINQAYRVEAHGFRVVLAPIAP